MAGKKDTKKAVPLDEKQKTLQKIGKLLMQCRIDAGYTAALDFAYQNDIHPAQYARYEAGTDDMKITSLLKVLAALDVSPSEFFRDFK
jgi:transcriptional regulator with XRE-family HTH domain